MKIVGKNYYEAIKYMSRLGREQVARIELALSTDIDISEYNVVRVDPNSVSFMLYPDLGTKLHPKLLKSQKVYLRPLKVHDVRTYTQANTFVLHKVHCFMKRGDYNYDKFWRMDWVEEEAGAFSTDHKNKIGRRKYWNSLCRELGLRGHRA